MRKSAPIQVDAAHTEAERIAVQLDYADEAAYRHLRDFVQSMWPVAVPAAPQCVWARHMRAICDEIEEVLVESDRRRERASAILEECGRDHERAAAMIEAELGVLPRIRLVILVPPRHSKSAIVSRLLPAWRWLHRPEDQILTLTSAEDLIERDGMAVRDVVKSPEYQRMQARLVRSGRLPQGDKQVPRGQCFTLRDDQFAKKNFNNTSGGKRAGYPLGAGYTGVDSDITIIDDPHDIDDAMAGTPAQQMTRMEEVRSTYKDKVQDRLNSQIWGVVILIMQPVHTHDLSEYMISVGARYVWLPAEYQPEYRLAYPKDWRKRPGEILNPLRFPASTLAAIRAESEHGYVTKWLLRPTSKAGGRYQRAWFERQDRRYYEDPKVLAQTMEGVCISVDAANKTGAKNDHCAFQVWGWKGARRYLFARVLKKMEIVELRSTFKDLCVAWPEATLKYVEDKANGTALIQLERDETPGIVPVEPRGDKPARSARSAEPAAEAGNIYLPANEPWVPGFVDIVCGFLAGAISDDDVDAMSQALEKIAERATSWLSQERRGALADAAPSWGIGELITRWGRKDPTGTYSMGVVPGWCREGDAAIAIVVDGRGRMVSLVDGGDLGVAAFIESASSEAAYWDAEVRYAEGASGQQIALGLAKARVRLHVGDKLPGQKGGGWKAGESGGLWAGFLGLLEIGLVGIRDGATLSRLEGVVADEGVPRMSDGSPLSGRVLALLLALAGNAARPVPVAGPSFTFVDSAPSRDLFAIGARR